MINKKLAEQKLSFQRRYAPKRMTKILIFLSLTLLASCGDSCGFFETQNKALKTLQVGDYLFGPKADKCVESYSAQFKEITKYEDRKYVYIYRGDVRAWSHIISVEEDGYIFEIAHHDS